jgi:endonuclease/exonuclease/phosphatase family metal-dependent hydrolase
MAREKFEQQLQLIMAAATNNCVILGDFNIDYSRKFVVKYRNKQLLAYFENVLSHLGLYQHVTFPMWLRTVNGVLKESILDHSYSNTPIFLNNKSSICPIFGDH